MTRKDAAPPLRRVARRQTASRQALLRSAFELFGEQGFHATTVADIAQRADVATGSFYIHFLSKDEALQAVIAGFVDTVGESIDASVRDYPEPLVRIAAGLRNVALKAAREPIWSRFLAQLALTDGRNRPIFLPRLTQDLQEAWASGVLPPPRNPGVPLSVLLGAILGVLLALNRAMLVEADLDEALLLALKAAGATDGAAGDALIAARTLLA